MYIKYGKKKIIISKVNSEPCNIEDVHNKSDEIIEEAVSLDAIKNMCIELGYYNRGIHVKQTNQLEMCYAEIPATIYGTKHDIIIADEIELSKMKEPDVLKFELPKLEEVKVNHSHGWYRKFEKKRF